VIRFRAALPVVMALFIAAPVPAGAVILPAGTGLAAPLQQASDNPPERKQATTRASGNSMFAAVTDLLAREARVPGAERSSPAASASRSVVLVEFVRAEVCGVAVSRAGGVWPCAPGVVLDHRDVCGPVPVVAPLWKRTRDRVDGPWSAWVLVQDVSCAEGAGPSADLLLVELRRLPITASVLHVQPDRGWVLAGADTIVFAESGPQVLTATVLGVQVTFTLTPVAFTWDFGDRRFTTTGPGHRFPDQDVTYRYTRTGTGHVDLTTTWQATYTTSTDPTVRPVPGTATTTTTGPTFQIRQAHTHLTAHTCTTHPHDPGC
jgi:hypothetical protein